MKTTNSRRNPERGSQIAELAIVLPLLAFLAFVVSEGAGFVRAHQVINNAAREGARLSAQQEDTAIATVQSAVVDYACFNRLKLANSSGNDPAYPLNACANTTFSMVCPSTTVAVNQAVLLTLASGEHSVSSQVTVTCNYPLSYLPSLNFPSLGLSVPNTIPLRATATFKNLY